MAGNQQYMAPFLNPTVALLAALGGPVALAIAGPSASPALDVLIASNGSYTVSVDGAAWFESADTFITSGGDVYSLSAGTLALEKTAKHTGIDGLGAFAQTTMVSPSAQPRASNPLRTQ